MDITEYLSLMCYKKSSDIFFSPGNPICLKIGGKTIPISEGHLSSIQCKTFVYSLLNEKQVKEFEENWELNFSFEKAKLGRFRVNVYKDSGHGNPQYSYPNTFFG